MKKYTKLIPLIITPAIMVGTASVLASCNSAMWYNAKTTDVTQITPDEFSFNFGKHKNVRIGDDVYDWIDAKITPGHSYYDITFKSTTQVEKMECSLKNRQWSGNIFSISRWFPINVKNLTINLSESNLYNSFDFGSTLDSNVFLDSEYVNRWTFNELRIIYPTSSTITIGKKTIFEKEGAFINKLIFQNVESNTNFTPEIKNQLETNFSLSGKVIFE